MVWRQTNLLEESCHSDLPRAAADRGARARIWTETPRLAGTGNHHGRPRPFRLDALDAVPGFATPHVDHVAGDPLCSRGPGDTRLAVRAGSEPIAGTAPVRNYVLGRRAPAHHSARAHFYIGPRSRQ